MMMLVYTFIVMLTNTFLILYALETLSIKQLGLILGIKFGIQALTDYPTGALGDWIGQRWVLFIASLSFAIGLIMLSYANNFELMVFGFAIIGFAQGQESGAFHSWFDNNYLLYVHSDKDRRIYGQLFGKFTMMKDLTTAIAFIFGGLLIYFSSRQVLFYYQGIVILFFSIIFVLSMKDHPSASKRNLHFKNYFGFLNQGISIVTNDGGLIILISGLMITGAGMMLWAGLILLPLYESYGHSDIATAVLRSTIWLFGAIGTGIASVLSKRIKNLEKGLSISFLILDVLFFSTILIMVTFYQPTSEFNLLLVILLIIAFTIGFAGRYFVDVLLPRYFIDKIPNSNRNAIYSLIPTMIMIFSVPYLMFGGFFLQQYGVQTILIILTVNGFIGALLCAYGIIIPIKQNRRIPIVNLSENISSVSA
jgi:MFS family permease